MQKSRAANSGNRNKQVHKAVIAALLETSTAAQHEAITGTVDRRAMLHKNVLTHRLWHANASDDVAVATAVS